ncbi:MAG: phosphoglucomutase [Bacteroidota bacterium]|nr:phosphoglucomutase [Bacteroidota bacterium]
MGKLDTIKFGNDGWRALTGEIFNEENLIRVAEAFVRYLQSNNLTSRPVAIGFDGRKDSDNFAALFAQVLSGNNIPVILSQSIVPTPVLSFSVKHLNCSSGIMITASHNPAAYNGVKFKAGYGGPFIVEETRKVREFLREEIETKRNDVNIVKKNFLPDYILHLQTIVDFSALKFFAENPANNPSVIIDSMGGAGQTILEDILIPLGWRAQTIFGSPEPNFYDRKPEPIEKNLEPLLYNVSATDAILGIATDGDGDRCAICFEDGKWISVQQTILLLLWHLHEHKKLRGAIIKSVPVTDKVRVFAERWNFPFYEVNVSFQNIAEIMLRTEYMLGVEESAGFGIQGNVPERDGILSGLLFCELLAMSGKSLYELWDDIKQIVGELHYKRIDLKLEASEDWKESLFNRCEHFHPSKNLEEFFIEKVRKLHDKETLNGIKFLFGDSRWLLIRASQTEPLVRIYAEGRTDDELNRLLEEGKMLIIKR